MKAINNINKKQNVDIGSVLYIVATPIGNIKDITYRAVSTLQKSDLIIVENSHKFRKMCNLLNLDITNKKITRFGDFNNNTSLEKVIHQILDSKNTSLVTEAGTPLISDPGYKIVNYIRKNNLDVNILAVPGPSAITSHLSISGLPTDNFLFVGFLPKSKGKAEKILKAFKLINNTLKTTFVIYESKYRIIKTLEQIHTIYPDSKVSIGNELTKMYEKVYYGTTKKALQDICKTTPKGEFVIHLLI